MKVFINGTDYWIEAGSTLSDAVRLYSPFGINPVVIRMNGYVIKEDRLDCQLKDDDHIEVFPLLIGG